MAKKKKSLSRYAKRRMRIQQIIFTDAAPGIFCESCSSPIRHLSQLLSRVLVSV